GIAGSMVGTFLFVVLAWLFFRAPDFNTAWFYLDRIFINRISGNISGDLFGIFLAYFVLMLLIDVTEEKMKKHEFLVDFKPAVRYGIMIPVWVTIIMYLYTVGKPMPFIY